MSRYKDLQQEWFECLKNMREVRRPERHSLVGKDDIKTEFRQAYVVMEMWQVANDILIRNLFEQANNLTSDNRKIVLDKIEEEIKNLRDQTLFDTILYGREENDTTHTL